MFDVSDRFMLAGACVCVYMVCVGDVCMWKANQHYHTSERRLILPFSRGSSPEVPHWSLQVTHNQQRMKNAASKSATRRSSRWKRLLGNSSHSLQILATVYVVSSSPAFGQINRFFLSHRSPQNLHQELWDHQGNERSASRPTAEVGSGPQMAPGPPLTCAGGVLQAASLPEGGQGLALGPRRGPGGHAGGHVARISSVRTDWPRAERVFGGMNVGGREKTRRRRRRGRRKMQHRCWELQGGFVAVSLRACVRAYMCLHARALRACEQGFPH